MIPAKAGTKNGLRVLMQFPSERVNREADLACLTASRRRRCLRGAVAFGLPLNAIPFNKSCNR